VLDVFDTGTHKLFARGWLWTVILLIAASQVARITGMSHCTWRESSYISEPEEKEKTM
jgi:hypothetical protein